jgi:hypothetical protein
MIDIKQYNNWLRNDIVEPFCDGFGDNYISYIVEPFSDGFWDNYIIYTHILFLLTFSIDAKLDREKK